MLITFCYQQVFSGIALVEHRLPDWVKEIYRGQRAVLQEAGFLYSASLVLPIGLI